MIDPQSQANQWIRSLEQENKLTILKLGDKDFNLQLETAIRNGHPALLENIGEDIDASLDFLLGKQLFKHSELITFTNWTEVSGQKGLQTKGFTDKRPKKQTKEPK